MLTIALKRKHFKGTKFYNSKSCAISKALKERYKTDNVLVSVHAAEVNGERRSLVRGYYSFDFEKDKMKASDPGPEDAIIRKVLFV